MRSGYEAYYISTIESCIAALELNQPEFTEIVLKRANKVVKDYNKRIENDSRTVD